MVATGASCRGRQLSATKAMTTQHFCLALESQLTAPPQQHAPPRYFLARDGHVRAHR